MATGPTPPPSSFVNAREQGLSILFILLPGTFQAVSLLNGLPGNYCSCFRGRGGVVISEEITRGRFGSVVTVRVGVEGKLCLPISQPQLRLLRVRQS